MSRRTSFALAMGIAFLGAGSASAQLSAESVRLSAAAWPTAAANAPVGPVVEGRRPSELPATGGAAPWGAAGAAWLGGAALVWRRVRRLPGGHARR